MESAGYHTGHVGNSHNSFETSVVMFKRGFRPEAVRLGDKLGIKQVRLLSNDIRADTKTGNPVVIVVGQDKARFSG